MIRILRTKKLKPVLLFFVKNQKTFAFELFWLTKVISLKNEFKSEKTFCKMKTISKLLSVLWRRHHSESLHIVEKHGILLPLVKDIS